MRGRNRSNKGPNPLTRTYESNGPDVKIRGTAQHIAEKYSQLSRDAQAAGDPIAAENYLQHAEHYFRIIAASQEQVRQHYGQYQRSSDDEQDEGEIEENGNGFSYDGGEQPTVEDMDFPAQQQTSSYEGGNENRREQRPQRRSRYGRIDRSSHHHNGEQSRPETEHAGEEQGERSSAPVRERSPRQEQQQPEERPTRRRMARNAVSEESRSPSLPAFLTTPVRQPALAKAEASENLFGETVESEETAKPLRRRRRTVRASDNVDAETDDI